MAQPSRAQSLKLVWIAAYWVVPWQSFREIAQKSLNDDHTVRS
jgi:hypothetical protein